MRSYPRGLEGVSRVFPLGVGLVLRRGLNILWECRVVLLCRVQFSARAGVRLKCFPDVRLGHLAVLGRAVGRGAMVASLGDILWGTLSVCGAGVLSLAHTLWESPWCDGRAVSFRGNVSGTALAVMPVSCRSVGASLRLVNPLFLYCGGFRCGALGVGRRVLGICSP